MPDKIVAMTFEGNTAIIGMTKEQYALLSWLNANGAFHDDFNFAEWDEHGEEIPTDPDEV